MIIDADAAAAPLRELVRFGWQGFQRRTIDLFEQLPARHAEPADRMLLVEMRQKFADRRVDLRQAIEYPVTQPSQQPSLDDEHGLLNLRLGCRFALATRKQNWGEDRVMYYDAEGRLRSMLTSWSWPLPDGMMDAGLEEAFYAHRRSKRGHRRHAEPDWPTVHRELKRKHVTLLIVWDECRG